jgi:putative acetyltransferase
MAVHDAYAGRGAGTALMAAIVDLADNWLQLRRLELNVYADNARAVALYERFGFEREGLMRAYAWRNGEYVDSVAMARLRL